MKKRVVAVLMTAVMAMGMVACGGRKDSGSDKEGKSEDGKVVINFFEHSDSAGYLQEFVDTYEANHPDVDINMTIVSNDDYDTKIKTMLAGGGDVDVFWLRSGDAARQLAEDGALLPMNELCEKNNVDTSVYGECQDAYELDGETYGLATTKTAWMLFYNKDLFDAAGLPYPEAMTWDEYTELAKSLTTEDLRGGLIPNWNLHLGSAAAGEQLMGDLPYTKEWINYLNQWYVEDKSHYGVEEMSGSFDPNGTFGEGNTYMMINGDWTFGTLPTANPEFEWDCAPLPTFEGMEGNTIGTTSVYAINSKCSKEKIDVAFDFIKFMCHSDEGAKIYAENNYVPAYPCEEAKEIYMEKIGKEGAGYMFEANILPEGSLEIYYGEVNTAFTEEMELALVGSCTIDEAFKNFEERRADIIKSYE